MSLIEQQYRASIEKMSTKERICRSVALFNWSREFISRQIKKENPEANEQTIRLLVAKRIYGEDSGISTLIEEEISRVSS